MKKKNILTAFIALAVATGIVCGTVGFIPALQTKATDTFTININSCDSLPATYGSGEFSVISEHGNEIIFGFEDASKIQTNGENGFMQLSKNNTSKNRHGVF